jgi:hypothetical protein
VLTAILLTLDQSKKNPTKSNLMYLCIFMLLSFSSCRELAMTLNDPYTLSLKFDMPAFEKGTCSFADLIFC